MFAEMTVKFTHKPLKDMGKLQAKHNISKKRTIEDKEKKEIKFLILLLRLHTNVESMTTAMVKPKKKHYRLKKMLSKSKPEKDLLKMEAKTTAEEKEYERGVSCSATNLISTL